MREAKHKGPEGREALPVSDRRVVMDIEARNHRMVDVPESGVFSNQGST